MKVRNRLLLLVCVLIGIIHAAMMYLFATGPELSPIVVWFVDFPIVYPLERLGKLEDTSILVISITVCSLIYPAAIYYIIKTIKYLFKSKKNI